MKSKKVTKKQLKGAVMCNMPYWHSFIEKHWPRWWWKMSMVEILMKARELGVADMDVHWILGELDYKNCPGLDEYNLTSKEVVDEYLDLAKRQR